MIRLLLAAFVAVALLGACFDGDDDDPEEEIGCTPDESGATCALDATSSTTAEESEVPSVTATIRTPESPFAGVESDGLVLGSPDAPLELIVYEDFQCPFCGRFSREDMPHLVEDFVRPGLVRVVFHPIAALGRESMWAAEAARCAADQGLFWEYYHVLFSNQGGENRGVFAKPRLKAFADTIDIDHAVFDPCLDNDQYVAEIEASTQEAFELEVTAVPAFQLNGRFLIGVTTYALLKGQIEAELAP